MPGAVEQGVPGAVLDAIEHDLSPREQQRLRLLLRTWLPGFSRLSHDRRESVLRVLARQPGAADANRLPGAAEGCARVRVHAPRPVGGDRLSGAARPARRCARAAARAARGARRPRAGVRRLRRRLGRGRRRRRRGARRGRARRRRARGGRLLVGARLRRGRAGRVAAPLPRRRRVRDRRPGDRPDRGRLPRRRHRRQLHDLVPDARGGPGGVGVARLPGRGRLRRQPRRGLRAPRRQHRPQPAVAPRRGAASRARGTRLARRRDAAQRARLRPGRRLRLLRLRLPARGEAVDPADVARGRCRRGRTDRRRRQGACACWSSAGLPSASTQGRSRCARGPSSPLRGRSTRLRCCCARAFATRTSAAGSGSTPRRPSSGSSRRRSARGRARRRRSTPTSTATSTTGTGSSTRPCPRIRRS